MLPSTTPRPTAGRLLAALCPAAFVGVLTSYVLSPFLPTISDELQVSIALLGQVSTLTVLLAAALGLLLGPITDTYGQRRVLVVGSAAAIGNALLTALAHEYLVLLLAAIFGAASLAMLWPVAFSVAGRHAEGAVHRHIVSRLIATVGLTAVVGVPLLTTIGQWEGWRAPFVLLALMGAIAGLLVFRLLPPDPPVGTRPRAADTLAAVWSLLRDPTLAGFYAAVLLRCAVSWAMVTYLGALLVERYSLSLSLIGLVFAGFGLAYVVGGLTIGGPLGRLPLRPLLGAADLVSCGLGGALFLAPLPLPLAVLTILMGLAAMGISEGAEPALLAVDGDGGATRMTLYGSVFNLGSALGAGLGGLLLAIGGFTALGVSFPLLGLVAALLLWQSRPRTRLEAPGAFA
jgi:MFS transporter, DHA1 family, inner membrane transport protein